MLKNILVKKEYLLIVGSVLFLIICYRFAFRNTIDAWQLHSQLARQQASATSLSFQPDYLERKANNLNTIIGLYKADTALFRSNAISAVSELAEKNEIRLVEVPTQSPQFQTDLFHIQQLNFEGSYFGQVSFLSQLHSLRNAGVVRSLRFRLKKAQEGNVDAWKLNLEVYLQIIR